MTAFAAIAAFIVGGPAAAQIFGVESTVLRSWIMFSSPGLGVIDLRLLMIEPDGTPAPVDRFEMLGVSRTGRWRRIENRDELARLVDRICKVAGAAADIRVSARQATRNGWRILDGGARNACAG